MSRAKLNGQSGGLKLNGEIKTVTVPSKVGQVEKGTSLFLDNEAGLLPTLLHLKEGSITGSFTPLGTGNMYSGCAPDVIKIQKDKYLVASVNKNNYVDVYIATYDSTSNNFTIGSRTATSTYSPVRNLRLLKVGSNYVLIISSSSSYIVVSWVLTINADNTVSISSYTTNDGNLSGANGSFDFQVIDETRFLCVGSGAVSIATVSSSSVSFGSTITLSPAVSKSGNPAISPIDLSGSIKTFIAGFSGKASILSVNGSAVTLSLTSTLTAYQYGCNAVKQTMHPLGDSKYLCSATSTASPYSNYTVVLTIGGSSITEGTKIYVGDGDSYVSQLNGIIKSKTGKYIVVFDSAGFSSYPLLLGNDGSIYVDNSNIYSPVSTISARTLCEESNNDDEAHLMIEYLTTNILQIRWAYLNTISNCISLEKKSVSENIKISMAS